MSFELLLTLGVLCAVLIALVMDLLSADGACLVDWWFWFSGASSNLSGRFRVRELHASCAWISLCGGGRTPRDGCPRPGKQLRVGHRTDLLRMCPSVTVYSAFLNNTPVVAMGIPAIRGWCQRHGVSPSKLLMPLSFAAILGGICTLIGTSTNLVAHGLLQSHGFAGLGFFELAWIGVLCAIIGLAYVIFVAPALVPERVDIRGEGENRRAQFIEVELAADIPFGQ